AACRFNDLSASSTSLRNRSFSACAFSSCRRRVSTCRVSSSIPADSLDSLPLIQFKVTKLAGFVHCLVQISRFHNALNPVNKYLHFSDVRPEEWTPSYSGNASRMDYLLKPEQIVVETKMTRKGLGQKEVVTELAEDILRYQSHQDCKTLICFVYDPAGRCSHPTALEHDLSKDHSTLRIIVIVQPKRY